MGLLSSQLRAMLTICIAAAVAVLVALAPEPVQGQSGRYALLVIISSDNPTSDISLNELRRIFRSENTETPSGKPYFPLNQPARTTNRMHFDEVVLRMTPDQVGRFWIDRKIRGKSGAPRSVNNQALLSKVVAKVPNAISYIEKRYLGAGVKVVKIDGHGPSDGDYPLWIER